MNGPTQTNPDGKVEQLIPLNLFIDTASTTSSSNSFDAPLFIRHACRSRPLSRGILREQAASK
jgi:hypothetical protein